jgi:hypothetical protein
VDVDIHGSRQDKKAGAVNFLISCRHSGAGVDDPAVANRDICPAPIGKLDIDKDKTGSALHAIRSVPESYSNAVLQKAGAGLFRNQSNPFSTVSRNKDLVAGTGEKKIPESSARGPALWGSLWIR